MPRDPCFPDAGARTIFVVMQRLTVAPCPDWHDRAAAAGFPAAGVTAWCQDAAWRFSPGDIEVLGDAAQRLEDLCLDWVEDVVSRGDYAAFGLPDEACALIEDSWRRQDKNLLGRLDLVWNGRDAPQLLRYAADAPAGLCDAAQMQAEWLDCHCNHCDQFNGIHEMLVEAWKHFGLWGHRVHIGAGREDAEGRSCADYLRDTAQVAGLDASLLHLEDLRWNGKRFTDQTAKPITVLCKLSPWSDLLRHPLNEHLRSAGMRLIEPAWKLLLTQEATLPGLRAAFPDDAHLRPVTALPTADGHAPVLGVWIVASRACGLGVSESGRDGTRFVPHMFE
ncbi:glutathionylspermidine synthase family protein [Ferrovibrio terrae]|uniref:Glutathionylspermidine synthase family protein n=1 Tax=Ferrovibrio terrae TaxID=2594003 RepID=A0A516H4D9_9PROT|nr:glutathionylspermidine synthase family protein [Ferrovibrio terrae]QDO98490.1 glutathionylspermidine synthase family protein [Ferrovibrio terrae]